MWHEALNSTGTEARALRLVAARLGESESETRRILTTIARVKIEGTRGKRPAKPAARPMSESVHGSGHAPPGVPALDEAAVRRYYLNGRQSGLSRDHALRAVAKRYRIRPHDARLIVADVESELHGSV
jgi:hypothetical protein